MTHIRGMAKISSTAGASEHTEKLSGFILAGGRSRRMGRDKAGLSWNDKPLLDHMIQLLSTAADSIRVVGRDDLPDRIPNKGPLGGIFTALEVSTTEKNLILAVDLPLMTAAFLGIFRKRVQASERSIVACRVDGNYPLCLGIRKSMFSFVGGFIAEGRLAFHDLIDAADVEIMGEGAILQTGSELSIFDNANTPEEWNRISNKKRD